MKEQPEMEQSNKKEKSHPVIEAGPKGGRITPEAMREWERTSISGVKSFMEERARVIKTSEKKTYENLLGELEKSNYDKILKHFEEILGGGIKWQVTDKETVYMGLYEQEQLRNFVYCLTEKEYKKRGKEIGPTTYQEIGDYIENLNKRWGLKEENEPSVGYLRKAIKDKNPRALADQIDLSISVEVRADDKGKELENLRRYRKFLYDKLPLEETSKTEEETKRKEKPETKKEKLPHEIELEQRPEPLEGEAFDVWLKRIGGPNVQLLESLKEYKAPKSKEETPLIINRNGNFVLNNENVSTYFNKEKLDEKLAEKDSNIFYAKKRGEYQLKKGLFQKPAVYFHAIVEELKRKQKIVADKRFGKSLEKWTEKPEAKEKEKPKEEPKKQKTIAELEEEMERLQTAYAPLGWFRKKPVVRDLGYYVNQNKIEEIKKEIEKLKTGKPTSADAKEEKVEEKKEKEETKKSGAVGSAVGGEIRMGESAEDVENRLQELSAEISTSSVLGRSKLEKEQKKLRKRLKKLKRRS